ncbi:AAA family ATPase [Clostridium sp. WB02_MRS01]|uniref:ParA family protein n=1 Tax=Clostridium sp. WB02_MRS01 TaxID=2605777 RepID=UPI0012B2286E|nr:AAA family ATPase [Clostridium sp. WB02_MRS01]MSS08865.1 AAA family ATPase [Clostridium sp. WB02_MRS01]
MGAKVISMINYKGGVGKTVSTYNIGYGLAFLNDARVLLIDLDPQCSLSTVCFKAISRTYNRIIDISNISEDQTINSVIKYYLSAGQNNPNIDLDKVITHIPYTCYDGTKFNKVDFIAATMYDSGNNYYEKGLDDLEIDIVRNYANQISHINLVTLFSRFMLDTKINQMYDFIIFDCPPANNIITQNALAVSDYYLIPTIMDDLSSNGINHLKNLIENSIFAELYRCNSGLIDRSSYGSQYECLKYPPQLLGIFETLRKTTVQYNSRDIVKQRFGPLLFDEIIYHHKGTGDYTSAGYSCFSQNINENNQQYAPHVNYGKLVLSILARLGLPKVNNGKTYNSWL